MIGIIISWIHGMSTENICNTAKNNKLGNQETFAIFMLTGLIICLLLVCPTLPYLSYCWEPAHLHPKRTRSHSLATAVLVLMTKSFSSSTEMGRQEDTKPHVSAWLDKQHCGPHHGLSLLPAARVSQGPLHSFSSCTPWEIRCWK